MAEKPSYYAYAVEKGEEGKQDSWTQVGAAFGHRDGRGFTIQLRAMPINGQLVLREPKEAEEQKREEPRRDDRRR